MSSGKLTLLQRGLRCEMRYFPRTILETELAARIQVTTTDDGVTPFVFGLVYNPAKAAPPGGPAPDHYNFGQIPEDVLAAIQARRGLLLIDHSNEGANAEPKQLTQLHQRMEAFGIPPDRVVFMTQNEQFEPEYRRWRATKGVPVGMSVCLYHCFLRQLATYVQRDMIPSGEFATRRAAYVEAIEQAQVKLKHYVCLNFTPRGHRLATMLHIMQHGLEENGYISFPGMANRKMDITDRAEDLLQKQPFPDLAGLMELLPMLEKQEGRKLDTDPFIRISPVIDVGAFWYYRDSCFSLVTESGVKSRGSERFTEKPFKAVLGLHPFLILGLPNTLRLMRQAGFRSFSPWIDETYDTLTDDAARVTAVLAEFRRLATIPLAEWPELARNLSAAVLHNYDHFAGPLQRHFVEEVENPLIDRLIRLAADMPVDAAAAAA